MNELKKMAIWKNHVVIGYVEMTQEVADALNNISGIGVYIGFDPITAPERYEEERNARLEGR